MELAKSNQLNIMNYSKRSINILFMPLLSDQSDSSSNGHFLHFPPQLFFLKKKVALLIHEYIIYAGILAKTI